MTKRNPYINPLTLVDLKERRMRHSRLLFIFSLLFLIVVALGVRYAPNRPVTYADPVEHFKYGSIGSDIENGLPQEILEVLPAMFPEYLPKGSKPDYSAFGFIYEARHAMPIGFSTRRRIIDLAGINCAACHVGAIRTSPDDEPIIIPAMPANTVDLGAFFQFLFRCMGDSRFKPDAVIAEIAKRHTLLPTDRFILGAAVTALKAGLLERKAQLDSFMPAGHPPFGPGRVDTFNPYKVNQFQDYYRDGIPEEERYGTSDFPAIWNQGIRKGMRLHWDGNNDSIAERNFSAGFGAGATRENVDEEAMNRVRDWLMDLPPPKYPYERSKDPAVLTLGEKVYKDRCYSCHDAHTETGVGTVVPLALIGTDPGRFNSYTEKLAGHQIDYGKNYPWQFSHFKKTEGYSNQPLDGVWARAPYLHNGSVPTLWDLLQPEDKRPKTFYTGHGVYDPEKVGFRTDVKQVKNGDYQRPSYLFDTAQKGNGNLGHKYGIDLSDAEKKALIEFLKGM